MIEKFTKQKPNKARKSPGDRSIGHKHVYPYLNKTLPDKDMKAFASHLSNCSSCLDIVVQWHYEIVADEMYEAASNTESADTELKGSWGNSQKTKKKPVVSKKKSRHSMYN